MLKFLARFFVNAYLNSLYNVDYSETDEANQAWHRQKQALLAEHVAAIFDPQRLKDETRRFFEQLTWQQEVDAANNDDTGDFDEDWFEDAESDIPEWGLYDGEEDGSERDSGT